MRLRVASRTELAREAGLSQPTVGRIVDEMIAESILTVGKGEAASPDSENGNGTAQLGRPSTPLELDRKRRRFVVVQVGVNQTRMAALPMRVSDADEWEVSFITPTSPEAFANAVQQQWKRVAARSVQAVVVSLPGVVDEGKGRVLYSPNLHWTERADFAQICRPMTRATVICVQEIRALALGQLAAEPASDDFLLVDFGSGVGAAAVIRGKLYDSPLPLSGELGHTPIPGNDRVCSCGATGCIETLVSRNGMLVTSRQHSGPRDWTALVSQVHRRGLPDWLVPSLDAVATTIAGGLNLLGLRQAILTGALTEMPAASEYLCTAVSRAAMWSRFGQVRCRVVPRRRMAGMVTLAINSALLGDVEPAAARERS